METIIGFVAGYLAGCNDGKDGIKKLRDSVQAIMGSAEARRLTGEAMSLAEAAVRRAAEGRNFGSLSGTFGTVTDIVVRRAGALGKDNRAA
jgi:hypothetical protein